LACIWLLSDKQFFLHPFPSSENSSLKSFSWPKTGKTARPRQSFHTCLPWNVSGWWEELRDCFSFHGGPLSHRRFTLEGIQM
jgi:hypothetical protein